MKTLPLLALILAVSCTHQNRRSKVEYVNGRQLLSLEAIPDTSKNELVGILAPKQIKVGQELLAQIFLNQPELDLVKAFIDCDSVAQISVDTTTYDVSACSKQLVVRNDTIRIGLRQMSPGSKSVGGIKILIRDSNRAFRIVNFSFNYSVDAYSFFDNDITGIWTDGSGPNASFSIDYDSIYNVEHFTSIKYEQVRDSIIFYYEEGEVIKSKAYRSHQDTLIIESQSNVTKFWRFKD